MTRTMPIARHRSLRLMGSLAALAVLLGACARANNADVTATIAEDYRMRHPIAIQEAQHSVEIFVGHARGGLSISQRTDVLGLAQSWRREATGPILVDVPVDTPNAAAAADAYREVRSLLTSAGVPSHGITVHHYTPDDPRQLATIRLNYPKISAVAGPCGLWPDDVGPSIMNRDYSENRSYYNFGCAYQRNMAAMVDNPSDLVQPRPETPAYTARRSEEFDKYRKGNPTDTVYTDGEKAKLSDAGK